MSNCVFRFTFVELKFWGFRMFYGSTTALPQPKQLPMTSSVIVDPEWNSVQGNVRLIWRLSPLFRLQLTGPCWLMAEPFK